MFDITTPTLFGKMTLSPMLLKASVIFYLFLFTVPLASCHSWVEQLMNIAPNGTFVGEPGYPRGNVKRTAPGFSDTRMTYLLPPNTRPIGTGVLPEDKMCMDTQRTREQTAGSPRLKASPGAMIALRFQENGHVSLPDAQPGKPKNRGFVYVYGTSNPRPDDTLLSIHKVWNSAGTGGDRRGQLLSRQNFDDGRCYQINDQPISKMRQQKFPHQANELMGADMWCQQDIALPQNVPAGKPYTLYWVWDWPTAPGADPGIPKGKAEIYTTCMDIDVVEKPAFQRLALDGEQQGYIQGQPLNNAAIQSQVAQLNSPPMIPTVTRSLEPTTFSTKSRPSTQDSNTPTRSPTGVPSSAAMLPTGVSSGPPAITIIPLFPNTTQPLSSPQLSRTETRNTVLPTHAAHFRFRRNSAVTGQDLRPEPEEHHTARGTRRFRLW
ncbi:hypothetical protein LOZ61_003888 [Ophidiomyces ophidiicola]|nr:uncharacterized protein LOZ57_001280 [Ophidiomyces ophidiicola]KAI1911365.1 hypothetical protein LOZ61_003888 [Ophidiomyces ophidiicola]KAI1951867.1 hypothetical protein LOZ57_001280 [Ophidiomyces ophidiicola]KAI2009074.1 hypothetical protein LOZ50_001721 [Ophidiomyces ophidiicola]KAI2014262.1 hypothetical protein LOZ49_001468 [Ophidiomyces ophidiicola]KAI2021178.1 hypothetical protein LOZ46_002480 [Ophidiomyces ophidiicola]